MIDGEMCKATFYMEATPSVCDVRFDEGVEKASKRAAKWYETHTMQQKCAVCVLVLHFVFVSLSKSTWSNISPSLSLVLICLPFVFLFLHPRLYITSL